MVTFPQYDLQVGDDGFWGKEERRRKTMRRIVGVDGVGGEGAAIRLIWLDRAMERWRN